MTQLRGNYIFVQPGEKAFKAASNLVNYLELGSIEDDKFYLIASIENNEFVVSARLFNSSGQELVEIKQNNIRHSPTAKIQFFPAGGYEIVDNTGGLIIRLKLMGALKNECLLQGKFYNEEGSLVAKGDDEDLRIYKAPAVLGKSGGARGIVIAAPSSRTH
jgi:hypothetical protein